MRIRITHSTNRYTITEVIENVKNFELFFVDETPCLSVWYTNDKNAETFAGVRFLENI